MAVDERARRELYEAAEQKLGAGPADTLMEMLPPVGWADVATRSDLSYEVTGLRLEMKAMEARLGSRIDQLRAEMHAGLNSNLRWTVGTVLLGLLATVVAIAQIT